MTDTKPLKLKPIPPKPVMATDEEIARRAAKAKRQRVSVSGPGLNGSWAIAQKKVATFAKANGVTEANVRVEWGSLRTARLETDQERLTRVKRAAASNYRNSVQNWEWKLRDVERHNNAIESVRRATTAVTQDDASLIKELVKRGYIVSRALLHQHSDSSGQRV